MNYISVNGHVMPAAEPALVVSNRGYRYGDGLFETMKVVDGKIQLGAYHFERLFSGIELLKFKISANFTPENITSEINSLCIKNGTGDQARVRLSVSSGNGALDDSEELQYVIECWPLDLSMNALNENGLVIGIYPEIRKSCDQFSNLKSSSALIYSVAARHAKKQRWDDALVLNTNGNIADSTIANVFIIKDGHIITPPSEEGCVKGVMRRFLIERFREAGYVLREEPISPKNILAADELFLTNSIRGIRWVKELDKKVFTNEMILSIYTQLHNAYN
jgi:branched-chain amino acid aminotransferase